MRTHLAPLIAIQEDNITNIEGVDDEKQQRRLIQISDVIAENKYEGKNSR